MKEDRSWTEIDLSNFEHNLTELKKRLTSGTAIMQIVKADAYGHGAYQISRKAIECGVAWLGVANVQEGLLLRYQGIEHPILILSPSLESEIELIVQNDLTPTISDLSFARELNDHVSKPTPVHVNIDTGMGRSGINYSEAIETIAALKKLSNIKIEGIFSHFSASENDPEYSQMQSQRFLSILAESKLNPKFIHIANSSAVLSIRCEYANLVRIGLLSYGIYADASQRSKIDLKPVMTFKTHISQIKHAAKGDFVGYNKTFQTQYEMNYAIIPVGYADGYDFLLSNKGKVIINEQLCHLIGKVSMDMIAVDISEVNCRVGDEVILLGGNNEQLAAENTAALFDGLSYELLCQIGRRAKRYYYEQGELIASSPLLRRDFVSFDYDDEKLNTIIEAAIAQRLQSKDISNLLYTELVKRFFTLHDKNIHYRRNFCHYIEFRDHNFKEMQDYFQTNTTLTFTKILQNDYFYVACAEEEAILEKYFLRTDVEYRWLLDKNLEATFFDVASVKINELELYHDMKMADGCLEIRCFHPELAKLKGQEVEFSISTQTFYSKAFRQLPVYLIEMTQGVEIIFNYGNVLKSALAVPIFSGRSKFPEISSGKNEIKVSSQSEEWIFPTSGVVFVY